MTATRPETDRVLVKPALIGAAPAIRGDKLFFIQGGRTRIPFMSDFSVPFEFHTNGASKVARVLAQGTNIQKTDILAESAQTILHEVMLPVMVGNQDGVGWQGNDPFELMRINIWDNLLQKTFAEQNESEQHLKEAILTLTSIALAPITRDTRSGRGFPLGSLDQKQAEICITLAARVMTSGPIVMKLLETTNEAKYSDVMVGLWKEFAAQLSRADHEIVGKWLASEDRLRRTPAIDTMVDMLVATNRSARMADSKTEDHKLATALKEEVGGISATEWHLQQIAKEDDDHRATAILARHIAQIGQVESWGAVVSLTASVARDPLILEKSGIKEDVKARRKRSSSLSRAAQKLGDKRRLAATLRKGGATTTADTIESEIKPISNEDLDKEYDIISADSVMIPPGPLRSAIAKALVAPLADFRKSEIASNGKTVMEIDGINIRHKLARKMGVRHATVSSTLPNKKSDLGKEPLHPIEQSIAEHRAGLLESIESFLLSDTFGEDHLTNQAKEGVDLTRSERVAVLIAFEACKLAQNSNESDRIKDFSRAKFVDILFQLYLTRDKNAAVINEAVEYGLKTIGMHWPPAYTGELAREYFDAMANHNDGNMRGSLGAFTNAIGGTGVRTERVTDGALQAVDLSIPRRSPGIETFLRLISRQLLSENWERVVESDPWRSGMYPDIMQIITLNKLRIVLERLSTQRTQEGLYDAAALISYLFNADKSITEPMRAILERYQKIDSKQRHVSIAGRSLIVLPKREQETLHVVSDAQSQRDFEQLQTIFQQTMNGGGNMFLQMLNTIQRFGLKREKEEATASLVRVLARRLEADIPMMVETPAPGLAEHIGYVITRTEDIAKKLEESIQTIVSTISVLTPANIRERIITQAGDRAKETEEFLKQFETQEEQLREKISTALGDTVFPYADRVFGRNIASSMILSQMVDQILKRRIPIDINLQTIQSMARGWGGGLLSGAVQMFQFPDLVAAHRAGIHVVDTQTERNDEKMNPFDAADAGAYRQGLAILFGDQLKGMHAAFGAKADYLDEILRSARSSASSEIVEAIQAERKLCDAQTKAAERQIGQLMTAMQGMVDLRIRLELLRANEAADWVTWLETYMKDIYPNLVDIYRAIKALTNVDIGLGYMPDPKVLFQKGYKKVEEKLETHPEL